jgi:hypothetical protein
VIVFVHSPIAVFWVKIANFFWVDVVIASFAKTIAMIIFIHCGILSQNCNFGRKLNILKSLHWSRVEKRGGKVFGKWSGKEQIENFTPIRTKDSWHLFCAQLQVGTRFARFFLRIMHQNWNKRMKWSQIAPQHIPNM